MEEKIKEIAEKYLDIQTLEGQGSDRMDFHDLAVWSIKAALEAAFKAGQEENR